MVHITILECKMYLNFKENTKVILLKKIDIVVQTLTTFLQNRIRLANYKSYQKRVYFKITRRHLENFLKYQEKIGLC